jgi:hypothetical protein
VKTPTLPLDRKGLILVGAVVLIIVLWFFVPTIVHAVFRHHASSGVVIDRSFTPAHDWIYMQPIPHENCTSTGKSEVCTTTFTYIPIPEHDPDRWSLRVRDDTGTEDWVDVPQSVYDGCSLNLYYPGQASPCRDAA